MRKLFNQIIQLAVLFILVGVNNVVAYDDKITHPALTKSAAENSKLDIQLKNHLGLLDGLSTVFPLYNSTTNIRDLLQQGSSAEDHPMCQASNHFHNPLLPWNASQMSDDTTPLAYLIRTYCNNTIPSYPYIYRKSNVTWATGYLSPSPDGNKYMFLSSETPLPINWDTARSSYYSALTGMSAINRDTDFATTFSALGHVLHLLEDMAVPAHVKTDIAAHIKEMLS